MELDWRSLDACDAFRIPVLPTTGGPSQGLLPQVDPHVCCRMLDDFGQQMENTQSRLDNVMKKLAKVSHMTSGNLPSNT